jgi:hypothetical protein
MSGNRTTIERPIGSQGVELQQQAVTNFLLVTAPPGVPLPVDLKMYLNAPCGPLNPIDVEDTGLNTNPRRYEKLNGVFSAPIARAGGIATALWTIATARPRTAGESTTIYTLVIENPLGQAVTGWLEIGGVAVTPNYHVETGDTVVIDFVAGMTTGNFDVNCNASVNGVVFQIVGTEA